LRDARNKEELDNKNIKYILNCAECRNFNEKDFQFLTLNMLDILSTELEKYFEKSWNFIDKAKESNSGILIHCVMGRSRSPAILISYLMYRKHFNSLFDTFNFVNEKRDINPNNSFMISLCNFEISHFNIPESTMKGFDILKAVARVENSNSKRLNKKKQGNERAQEFIKEFLTEDLMLKKAADGEFSKKKKKLNVFCKTQ